MKSAFRFLAILPLAPVAASAQTSEVRDPAKPEVALATKAARRAWEFTPPEKKALWQRQRDALINIDLAADTKRQVVIARGSPEPGAYHAHPTTTMLADNRTIFCVWNIGLADDLSETRDLASARPEKARELRAALEAWWKDTGAGFPTKNPGFDEVRWWLTNDQAAGKKAKSAAPPQD
jgi:hypothetical protein